MTSPDKVEGPDLAPEKVAVAAKELELQKDFRIARALPAVLEVGLRKRKPPQPGAM